jgi:hypothetical protein
MTRAWAAGAGPGGSPMTMDIDSTICGVHGCQAGCRLWVHQGARLPSSAGHPRPDRRGPPRSHAQGLGQHRPGAERFVTELVGRVRRAGAAGQLTLRGDCGFWSKHVTGACRRHRVRFSITVRQTTRVRAAIEALAESAWVEIEYSPGAVAQVAETVLGDDRLIVRRVRNLDDQGELFFDWRFHAFVTDRPGDLLELEADHRDHAVVELAIRDLKEGRGFVTVLRAASTPTAPGWCSPRGSQPGPVGGLSGAGTAHATGGQDPAPPADHPAGEMDHIGAPQSALAAAGLALGEEFMAALGRLRTLPFAA